MTGSQVNVAAVFRHLVRFSASNNTRIWFMVDSGHVTFSDLEQILASLKS